MDVQINTGAVSAAADQIDAINKKMQEEMYDIDTAIRTLQRNWEGSASNSCVNKYEYLKQSYADSRFRVINGFVSFLKNQVKAGYDVTEKVVSSAADAFK